MDSQLVMGVALNAVLVAVWAWLVVGVVRGRYDKPHRRKE